MWNSEMKETHTARIDADFRVGKSPPNAMVITIGTDSVLGNTDEVHDRFTFFQLVDDFPMDWIGISNHDCVTLANHIL